MEATEGFGRGEQDPTDVLRRGEAAAWIDSPRVSPATRAVLMARLRKASIAQPACLTADERDLLGALMTTLLPGDSAVDGSEAAAQVDRRLASGVGDGWRYDTLPADADAYRQGLAALRDALGEQRLIDLDKPRHDALIARLSRHEVDGFDGRRWFEDVLVAATEAHVAHPVSQLKMGCTAFADVPLDEPPASAPEPARSTRTFADHDVVDAVIVGSGAGGGPLAWRLARAGMSVVILEAGRYWDPSRDFATDEVAQAKLFWTDERLSAGSDPVAFGNNNSGIGVGGSTLHFTAYTPRPQPDDFTLNSTFGVGSDWPLGYATLEPYFDELEAILGVSGPEHYRWGPPRNAGYPLPPLPLNAAARMMQKGCDALGIATSAAPNAALSRPYASLGQTPRHACTQRGFCQAGCTTGAKGSVDVVFVPPALACGAELRTEAFVTRIERDATGRVSSVVYHQDGQERRQRCSNVFLCAGAIETPRLLMLNDDLPNGSGEVGRNFMAHTGLQLWGFFDEPTQPWRGIPGGLISEDTHRPADADFAGGYLLQSIGVMPVTYASQLARSGQGLYGDALGRHLARFDHVAGINILGECLPSASNWLELSDERDARGLPKPRIHFSAGDNELKLTAHAERTMRSIWSAAGATDVWRFQRFAHVIGTCRMGDDPSRSVVDAEGRCHDVPGLHICDNSIFPSALSVNPALTIMALSLHVADRFIARRRGSLPS